MQHWLLLCSVWGDARESRQKPARRLGRHAVLIAVAIHDRTKLEAAMKQLCVILSRDRADKTNAVIPALLNYSPDPEKLGYSLT